MELKDIGIYPPTKEGTREMFMDYEKAKEDLIENRVDDDIMEAKDEEEYLTAIDNGREITRYNELMRLYHYGSSEGKRNYAKQQLQREFGAGDYVYGQDEGVSG